nr:RNA polymerase sigma factor [Pedococcus badiiscoriae]
MRSVYDALAPRVAGYLRAHGSADPEALTHDVFLTLYQRMPELTGGAAGLRTFTFSLAHARLVDELRARQRQPVSVPYVPEDDHRASDSAEAVAVRAIGSEQAVALLESLNEGQREVVLLRVVAGLSLEETAATTGRSVGAVKQLQRRGLLALRTTARAHGVTP